MRTQIWNLQGQRFACELDPEAAGDRGRNRAGFDRLVIAASLIRTL